MHHCSNMTNYCSIKMLNVCFGTLKQFNSSLTLEFKLDPFKSPTV